MNKFPNLNLNHNWTEEQDLAYEVREEWGLEPDQAITELFSLMESNGINVFRFNFEVEDILGFYVQIAGSENCVFLNNYPESPITRQIFAAAHEIFHVHTQQTESSGCVDTGSKSVIESRADAFAIHFMMPVEAIKNYSDKHSLGLALNDTDLAPEEAWEMSCHFNLSYITTVYHLENNGFIKRENKKRLKSYPVKEAAKTSSALSLEECYPEGDLNLSKKYKNLAQKILDDGKMSTQKFKDLIEPNAF